MPEMCYFLRFFIFIVKPWSLFAMCIHCNLFHCSASSDVYDHDVKAFDLINSTPPFNGQYHKEIAVVCWVWAVLLSVWLIIIVIYLYPYKICIHSLICWFDGFFLSRCHRSEAKYLWGLPHWSNRFVPYIYTCIQIRQ